jgi:ribosomal protein S27E
MERGSKRRIKMEDNYVKITTCPVCNSDRIVFSTPHNKYWCYDCHKFFDTPIEITKLTSMPNGLPKDWRGRQLK